MGFKQAAAGVFTLVAFASAAAASPTAHETISWDASDTNWFLFDIGGSLSQSATPDSFDLDVNTVSPHNITFGGVVTSPFHATSHTLSPGDTIYAQIIFDDVTGAFVNPSTATWSMTAHVSFTDTLNVIVPGSCITSPFTISFSGNISGDSYSYFTVPQLNGIATSFQYCSNKYSLLNTYFGLGRPGFGLHFYHMTATVNSVTTP